MKPLFQNFQLLIQSIIYFSIWFLYGFGSEGLRRRDDWEMAKKIFDLAGNSIPLGWSYLDKLMGIVGYAVIMPLPFISATYLILTNIFPALPSPENKSALIPLLFALICLPLGPAVVNGGAFYSRFNSTPPKIIQKLRESVKAGSAPPCALVSYDPDSSKEEMELCVVDIELTSTSRDRRKIIERFFRDGYVRKRIHPPKSISIGKAIVEGARDNWLALKYFGADPVYSLEAGLRELSILQSRSQWVFSVVPSYRQIWFIDTYTEMLLQEEYPLPTMTDIAKFMISMQTGWSQEANIHFNKNVLPKLKQQFLTLLEKIKKNSPQDFTEGSRSYNKKVTDHLSKIINLF